MEKITLICLALCVLTTFCLKLSSQFAQGKKAHLVDTSLNVVEQRNSGFMSVPFIVLNRILFSSVKLSLLAERLW